MHGTDNYVAEMRRSNHDRADEIRQAVADMIDALNPDFSGMIGIEAPVLRGRIGKVRKVVATVVTQDSIIQ